ncbi:hypothetical protein MMC25_008220 [Agyrium rufum]|nr:hypothetical protein [Agyrium rufum]
MAPPKALFFDIGGVCVSSPFQGILEFEKDNRIAIGWINYAISRAAPNGAWHRLERGELQVNDEFYEAFSTDLQNPNAWREFHSGKRSNKKRKTLKELANPSQLGDPVSLKAETSNSEPTDNDRGARSLQQSGSGSKPKLKDLAMKNVTMLGDPVSLKAEAADSIPTDQDRGASSGVPAPPLPSSSPTPSPQPSSEGSSSRRKPLKELAKENITQLGDPVSLKAEKSDSTPTEQGRGSQSSKNPTDEKSEPTLKDLAKKNASQLGDPVSLKAETADSSSTQDDRPNAGKAASTSHSSPPSSRSPPSSVPPIPQINTRTLFPLIISRAGTLDPHMYPYLERLKASKKFVLGALSNTIPTEKTNAEALATPTSQARDKLAKIFDVFIPSAEIGMRKPEARIYHHAMDEMNKFAAKKGLGRIEKGEDVVFVDDIGENLRAAKEEVCWRTVKVGLGKTKDAVSELERLTGVRADGCGRESKL